MVEKGKRHSGTSQPASPRGTAPSRSPPTRFLELARGECKPLTYLELTRYFNGLAALLGDNADVGIIDEARVEKVYLDLRRSGLSDSVMKKRYGFFIRFVRYLWSARMIELPRNLESFGFKVATKSIKTYDLDEVTQAFANPATSG